MSLRERLDALQAEAPASDDPVHERVDAVLRTLADDDLQVLREVLGRWEAAGHPVGSTPSSVEIEPDDTGNVVEVKTKTLIATSAEWATFERVLKQLR
jgi:hypothetical protein